MAEKEKESSEYLKLMKEELEGKLRETLEYLQLSDEEKAEDDMSATVTPPKKGKIAMAPSTREKKVNVHAGHRARIRERMSRDERLDGFTDIELVEAMLSFIIPQRDTNVTAHLLLDKFGSIVGVMTAKPEDLFEVKGMTKNASILMPALWKVCMTLDGMDVYLTNRMAVINFLDALFLGGMKEGGYVLYLDERYRMCSFAKVEDKAPEMLRTAVNRAIETGASYVIPVVYGRVPQAAREIVRCYVGLHEIMDNIGVKIADVLFLDDSGYYAMDAGADLTREGEPVMTYIPTVLSRRTLRATEAIMRLRNKKALKERSVPATDGEDARKQEHEAAAALCKYLHDDE